MAREIKLSRGLVALVDDEDFEWANQFKWFAHRGGYAARNILLENGRRTVVFMHRQILGLGLNKDEWFVVDHINGVKSDNRRENIRACDQSKNNMNRGISSKNKSGFKGVSFSKRSKKWVAFIKINKKNKNLGSFSSKEAAHEAYKSAALVLHKDFANFGDGCVILKDKNVDS